MHLLNTNVQKRETNLEELHVPFTKKKEEEERKKGPLNAVGSIGGSQLWGYQIILQLE